MEERVFKVLKLINEDICSYQGSKMLEDKIIDSFEIMQIISDLEEEFNMEIDAENIIVENFKNAQSVIDMMKRCIMED